MNQLTLDFTQARATGRAAGDRAQARAERSDPSFSDRAKAYILACLADGAEISGEALTNACKAAGIVPPDDRAFGPVYASLAKTGQIRCVRFCLRAKGNGTAGGRVWRVVA